MTGRLSARRVLVVGGGQQDYGQPDPPVGIGRAISCLCAREGAQVVVGDRDPDAATATARAIAAGGGEVAVVAYDAADPQDAERGMSAAMQPFGGLDALVLNTGVAGGWDLEHTTADEWDRVFAVNVRAHFLGCRYAIGRLDDGGAIVLTSSTAARLPSTSRLPAYGASKAALDGLCRYAAKEGAARGVRVNVLMPGLIDTPLGRLASAVKSDRNDTAVPLGRHGTAAEVAEAAAFLLSSAAGYITGQTLAVDGGLTTVG